MWIVILLGVIAIGGYALLVAKAASMNREPLQIELAGLIVEMMARGGDDASQRLFAVSAANRFIAEMVTEQSEQQTRLAHALSLAKSRLGAAGYAQAKEILRGWAY